jgi:5-methyltetrahydrofolate--homocysteine methyltransferase
MISPDDFKRFVMPSLERICGFLDHSIYHWDGPGQIVHLEHLLSLPRLDGFQWVPGDGSEPVWDEKWFPLYEKVQAAGKVLVLHDLRSAENVMKICENFSPKGLWMSVTLGSEEEAKELLRQTIKV